MKPDLMGTSDDSHVGSQPRSRLSIPAMMGMNVENSINEIKAKTKRKTKTNPIKTTTDTGQFDLLGPEADHGLANNLGALCKKKANQFRREKKVFAYELLVPGLIILGGILLTRVQWYSRSEPKILTPELLPLP